MTFNIDCILQHTTQARTLLKVATKLKQNAEQPLSETTTAGHLASILLLLLDKLSKRLCVFHQVSVCSVMFLTHPVCYLLQLISTCT